MNTPYQWTKRCLAWGEQNGTIVHWPSAIKARGEIRSQFTTLSMWHRQYRGCGTSGAVSVNGIAQDPIEGSSIMFR